MPPPVILFVDDDQPVPIRKNLERILAHRGYQVATAASGREALALLDLMAPMTPEAVITDYTMEEMNGIDLLRKVKERCPETELYLSGGSDADDMREAARAASFTEILLLLKPWDPETLDTYFPKLSRTEQNPSNAAVQHTE